MCVCGGVYVGVRGGDEFEWMGMGVLLQRR